MYKKSISVFLVFCMIFSLVSFNVFATVETIPSDSGINLLSDENSVNDTQSLDESNTENNTENNPENNSENNSDDNIEPLSLEGETSEEIIKDVKLKYTFKKNSSTQKAANGFIYTTATSTMSSIDTLAHIVKINEKYFLRLFVKKTNENNEEVIGGIKQLTNVSDASISTYTVGENYTESGQYYDMDGAFWKHCDIPIEYDAESNTFAKIYIGVFSKRSATDTAEAETRCYSVEIGSANKVALIRDHIDESTLEILAPAVTKETTLGANGLALMHNYSFTVGVDGYDSNWDGALKRSILYGTFDNGEQFRFSLSFAGSKTFTVKYGDEASVSGTQITITEDAEYQKHAMTFWVKKIVGFNESGEPIYKESSVGEYKFSPAPKSTNVISGTDNTLTTAGVFCFIEDSVLKSKTILDVDRKERILELIKNQHPNDEILDIAVVDFELTDPDTGLLAESAYGTWDYTHALFNNKKIMISFSKNAIGETWNLDYVSGYKITDENEVLKLETYGYDFNSTGSVTFCNEDKTSVSGTYVIVQEKYTDLEDTAVYQVVSYLMAYTPVVNGMYSADVAIVDSKMIPLAAQQYFGKANVTVSGTVGITGTTLQDIMTPESNYYCAEAVGKTGFYSKESLHEMLEAGYTNAEAIKYVSLVPDNNGVYIKSIKIGGQDATVLEEYTVGENKYPKVIKIDGENGKKAYVEAEVTFSNDTTQTVQIAVNFLDLLAGNDYRAAMPEIATPTGKLKFQNRTSTTVNLSTTSVDAKIMYSINNGAEQEYTEPFTLTGSDTDDSTSYVIKAYTVKEGVADSATIEKTIVFREAGAYAEDTSMPVIKARYMSGATAAEGKYSLEILSDTEGAKIYYTTDGTIPSVPSEENTSVEYTQKTEVDALTNGAPTVIRAIAVAEGYNDSELSEFEIEFSTNWWDSILNGDVFEISARMYKWPYSEPPAFSMGNGALTGKAVLRKIDGHIYVDVDFQKIDMGIGTGNLIDFWYIKEQEKAESHATMTQALDELGVEYENYATTNFILNFATKCEYFYENDNPENPIDYIRMPLFNDNKNVVAALESDFAPMGKQFCVMNFDYSNAIEAITGQKVEKELIVDTPVIAPVLSADGDSYEISLYIPETSDAADADIYYMVSGDDEADLSGIISEANKYAEKFTVSKDDADELGGTEGTFNVYAVGVKSGYTNSVINTMKLTFDDASSGDSGDDGEGGGSGSGSTGGSTGDEADEVDVTKDGKYWVEIALYKASSNEESMGDVAFDKNRKALITTKNGTSTIQIASNPVSIPPYYSALKEMQFENKSGKWQYVTDVTRKTITANDGESKHSLSYLALFEFELPSTSDRYVPVKINVPYTPMDGISANVGGFIEARIMIDWSSLSKASSSATLKPSTGSSTGNSSYAGGGSSSTKDEDEETTTSTLVHDVTDKDTGIKITAEKDVYDAKATFEVTAVTEGTDYEAVAELLADTADNGYDVYEVSATLNNKEAKQTGFATLYFPVGDEDVNKTVIYSYAEETETTNAGLTALEIELSEDGKYYVVKVSEMGTFVVAQADEAVNSFTNDTASSAAAKFEDIENHWGKEYIEKAVEKGMFSGVSENRFAPDDTATRAMLVTVLSRLEGVDTAAFADKENIFDDIKSDDWFYAHVLWAAENGIVKGVAENLFDPNSDITREQMATILYRYIVSKGITLADGEAALFTDEAEISEYAKEAVAALAKAKIITGKDGGKFDPKGTATRAELATMLIRFVNEYMTESAE